jgi:lambda repressor-like predicted transcriptional regulator
MVEVTKPDKTRQLSQEQLNSIEHLLQGKSDRAVAEAVGVARQTIWEWRNHDVLFIAELNRQRSELWGEAHQRLKSMANRALDAVELQLDSGDPKASLSAARFILQGTRLLGDSDLPRSGPTTPEAVIMEKLRSEARQELAEEDKHNKSRYSMLEFDPFRAEAELDFANRVEDLARRRLKKAMAEAGLS